jgi:hypothetical protein
MVRDGTRGRACANVSRLPVFSVSLPAAFFTLVRLDADWRCVTFGIGGRCSLELQ